MKGFDPKYKDLPDYILGVTKEIWEDRGIDTLHRTYGRDILVRSPAGVVEGNGNVIAATMATLHEFPDRTLLGEDVIWSGSEDAGFLSSHRLYSTATHSGSGVYGAATGKTLAYRIIADCHAKAGVIDDEWIIRDQGAIVRQLGWDPHDYARAKIRDAGGSEAAARPFTPEQDRPGPYSGRGDDSEWGLRYAGVIERMMDAGFSIVPEAYDRACETHHPGGVPGRSHGAVDRLWMGLRASFPNAAFQIHHRIGRADPTAPPRAAIRWSLDGLHDGWGAFGRPTGARVHVMGFAHAEFGPFGAAGWSIRREFVLYDETAIWTQILLHTGDSE